MPQGAQGSCSQGLGAGGQRQGRVLGLSAGTAHTDRHINFVARSRDRMQFFFNLAAIAFQWQEVNATRQQGKEGREEGRRRKAKRVDESQAGSQLVSQPDKCGLCAARSPSQYSQ